MINLLLIAPHIAISPPSWPLLLRTWAIFFFHSGGYLCTPNSTVGHLSIFTSHLTLFLFFRGSEHLLLFISSFFFLRFRALAPFYFLIYIYIYIYIYLHNPCLFCIESFWRGKITILGTTSSNNIFNKFLMNGDEWCNRCVQVNILI
jgi:hypothetical protein